MSGRLEACDDDGVGLESHTGDGAGDGRDLVFVSYSHSQADKAWVQRVQVLAKPLLRSKRLRLWVDTAIRAGDEWTHDRTSR